MVKHLERPTELEMVKHLERPKGTLGKTLIVACARHCAGPLNGLGELERTLPVMRARTPLRASLALDHPADRS